ncbi:MAG: amidophosphoribosyltransferase [Anaerolineae bacterium]
MCGVIGIYSRVGNDVFPDVVNGMFQIQHRGQDACGIAISDGRRLRIEKGIGYVREVFGERPSRSFAGHVACGHVRYPTQGGNRLKNAQPHTVRTLGGRIMALGSNGDLTNYREVRKDLEDRGVEFAGTNDGELLLKHIAQAHVVDGLPLVDAIRATMDAVRGAYSACLITRDSLIAFRDPYAVRPLVFGGDEESWVVASETNALDIARVDLIDDVAPGEIIVFDKDGMQRLPHPDLVAARRGRVTPAHCSFEYIYFSRPDSIAYGERVYDVRKRIGAWLARHDDVRGDVVVPVPDSANAVTLGYALESGLPFEQGLVRNHYVGRTFISPDQPRRDERVKLKFNPLRSVFKGRRVILVDDSIVRGTTSRKLVRMVRAAGAAEVHMRIGSPVTRFPCYYGIDTPDAAELIGNQMDVEGIRDYLTADSLMYLTVDGLRECLGDEGDYCMACFDGNYPIALSEEKHSRFDAD